MAASANLGRERSDRSCDFSQFGSLLQHALAAGRSISVVSVAIVPLPKMTRPERALWGMTACEVRFRKF
jgi:hypothetical protein